MTRFLFSLLVCATSLVQAQSPILRSSLTTNNTSTNLFFNINNKRAGVNTANPPTAFAVVGDGASGNGIYFGTGAVGSGDNSVLWHDGQISHYQFGTSGGGSGQKLYIGSELTSIPGVWPVTINQGTTSGRLGINIASPSVELDVLGSGHISATLAANVGLFTNSLTLPFGTASTLLSLNGAKAVVSLANGTGVLTNDGSGNFGFTPMTGDVTNTYNTQVTTNLTVVNSATISNINYISGKGNKVYITNSIQLGDYFVYPLIAGNGISLSTNANPTSGTNLTATVTNVTEAQLLLAANTTANVSTTKHGFAPVLPNDATKYLDGTGAYSVPASSFVGIYRDQSIEAGAMLVGNLASPATTGTYTNSQDDTLSDSWTFADAATNNVRFSLTLPDAWDRGTIKLKLYVTCDATNNTSTNIVWGVKAGSLAPLEALTNAVFGTEVYVTNGLDTAGNVMQVFTTPAITVGGSPAAGDSLWFNIAREGGNASDTWTNTPVRLLKARVQWLESSTAPSSW